MWIIIPFQNMCRGWCMYSIYTVMYSNRALIELKSSVLVKKLKTAVKKSVWKLIFNNPLNTHHSLHSEY